MNVAVVTVDVDKFLRQNRGWLLAVSVIMILLGVAAMALPLIAGLAVTVVLGWLLLIGGVVQLAHAMRCRSAGQLWWELLVGVLYLTVGAILLFYPLTGVLSLTVMLAVLLIAEGIFELVLAMRWRPAGHWGWILVSGLLSLLLGVLIWAGLPGTAAWVLGLMVGIKLLFNGMTLMAAAVSTRRGTDHAAL